MRRTVMTRLGLVLSVLVLLASCGGDPQGDDGEGEEVLTGDVCGIPLEGDLFDTFFPGDDEVSPRDGSVDAPTEGFFICRVEQDNELGRSWMIVQMSDAFPERDIRDIAQSFNLLMDDQEEVVIDGQTFVYQGRRSMQYFPCPGRGEQDWASLGVAFEGPVRPGVEEGDVRAGILEVSEQARQFAKEDYGCDAEASGGE